MKVTLVRLPNFLLYDEHLELPLGLLYLANELEKHDVLVNIADLAGKPRSEWARLVSIDSDIYGISATTPDWPIARAFARWIRGIRPSAQIVLGGAHATVMGREVLAESDFDIAVKGEGEITMREIALGNRHPLGSWSKNGEIKDNGNRPLEPNITRFDYPAWHLLSEESLISTGLVNKGQRATCITASRGCMMRCSFCDQSIFDWTWRSRTRESLLVEVDALKMRYGVSEVRLVDEFISPKSEIISDVCEVMKENGIKWRTHIRASLMTPELAEKMVSAGCVEIAFGVESGSQRVLDAIHKGMKIEDSEKAIAICRAAGLRTKAYLIIGLPSATWDSFHETLAFIRRAKPDKTTLSTFCPYPGCDVWRHPEKYDYVLDDRDYLNYWILGLEDSAVLPPGHTSKMNRENIRAARNLLLEAMADYGTRRSVIRDVNDRIRLREEAAAL